MIWVLAGVIVLLLAAFFRAGYYWTDRNEALAIELSGYQKLNEAIEQRAETRDNRRLDQINGINVHVEKLEALLKTRDTDLTTARSVYAESEAELLRTQKSLADTEERLRFWMAMSDKLDQRCDKATADAIAAREIVADWVAQRTFGRSIFHKAPPLPEESLHRKPIPRARIQGRLAVQLADAAFAKQEAELLRQQREQAAGPAEPVRIEITPEANNA